MQTKILIIDDEEMILSMLKLHLESRNYLVYTANSAEHALEKLRVCPDIVLLDINMPGMSGLELCERIREQVTCPILFVTARVGQQDIIEGLMVGGDDYITKPFDMDELLARIQAHLRRENRKCIRAEIVFERELTINYSAKQVTYRGEVIRFSPIEFEIIELLSRNPHHVFDRETIYEKVWGYDGEGDSMVVKEHIRRIRNQLVKHIEGEYIQTIWGVGYQWIG